jgi:hypothetical protein
MAELNEPSRKYFTAPSVERSEPRRKPTMAYTPSDMVSRPMNSDNKSPAAAKIIAPTVAKMSSG